MKSQSGYFKIRSINLEYQWHGPQEATTPVLVFLHGGLGCVAGWGEFPQHLACKSGCSALVYSRVGYGQSDPVKLPRPLSFMHQEADLLPDILNYFGI